MKTVIGLSLSLLVAGLVGLTNMVGTKAFAGEERASAVHEHENIKLPTKRLMVEIEKRMYNILEGILVGNFKYVKQEAAAVTEKANQINENFFPRNPEIDVPVYLPDVGLVNEPKCLTIALLKPQKRYPLFQAVLKPLHRIRRKTMGTITPAVNKKSLIQIS